MLGHRLVQHAFEHTSTGWLLSNPPGYGPRVRDGDPLPGVSPDQVVSQLAHQVFGPLHLDRTRVVLDYHGLADRAAGTLAEIAARHGVTTRTVSLHVKAVRSVGSKLPLTPTVIAEATRRSTAAEDHLARVRIARTLALAAPHRPSTNADRTVPLTHLAPARNAMRILAAYGPLDTQPLLEAVGRSRRFRGRRFFSARDLDTVLRRAGAVLSPDGSWHAPSGTGVSDRYRWIVATAAGRDLTRPEMIQVLIDAGYSYASATGRMSSSHPLFRRVGPDRYRVVGGL